MGLDFPEFAMNKDYQKKLFQYNNYKYECRWARAYFYFTLVRQYGGVPLKVHNTTGREETALPRASADAIFDFIDAECADIQDSIVKDYTDLGDLALASPETGRANKYTVMALRAQAALYHASPLFNPSNDATLWYKAAKASRHSSTVVRLRARRSARPTATCGPPTSIPIPMSMERSSSHVARQPLALSKATTSPWAIPVVKAATVPPKTW
jgi:hypothetical protein